MDPRWTMLAICVAACGAPERVAAPVIEPSPVEPSPVVAPVDPAAIAVEPAPSAPVLGEGPPGSPILATAPPEHLARWTPPVAFEERALLAQVGPRLFAIGARRVVAYSADGTTPTRWLEHELGATDRYTDATIASAPSAQGILLIRGAEDVVAGLDVETLELRWTAHLNLDERSREEAHLATDDAFVIVSSHDLIGLDARSGARLFRRELAPHEQGPGYVRWRAAGSVFLGTLRGGRGVGAFDPRTGASRWVATEVGEARLYDVDRGRLPALVDHHTAVILRVEDGTELTRFPIGATVWHGRGVVLAGDTLYAGVQAGAYDAWQLRAYDVATGRVRWRSPTLRARADDHPDLAIDEDVVFACTDARVLHAFDRADGRARWWAFPRCTSPRVWHPVAGAPGVVLMNAGAGALYGRTAEPRVYRDLAVSGALTFEGRPRARVIVRVGDRWARTGADGRYRARVRAWDDVPVDVDCDGCVPLSRTLTLDDPSPRRRLDLPLESIPGYLPER